MVEINNQTKNKINERLVKNVAEKFLRHHKKTGYELSIAFVGDAAMRKLNRLYRRQDKPTDILSFTGENSFLGEVIIDYAQIKRQAKIYSRHEKTELIFILVHGLFHLLGYDDATAKGRKEMIALGNDFIKNI